MKISTTPDRGQAKQNTLQGKGLLQPADSGIVFTLAALCSVIISVIFSVVVTILADAKGGDLNEYLKGLEDSVLYNVFAYGLSSVGLASTVLVFAKIKKQRPFASLPFKKARGRYWLIAAGMTVGLLFGFSQINNAFTDLLKKIGYSKPDMTLPNSEWWQYLIWVVLAAVLPAFFEESIFRGYFAEGLKGQSVAFTVLVGGLAFSIFHQNPQQTPYQFICGAAYFLLAIRCGSLWPCVAMHFANNFIILTFDFLKVPAFSLGGELCMTVFGLFCFALGMIYLIFFDNSKATAPEGYNTPAEGENPLYRTKKGFFITAIIGAAICAVMWVTDLITYLG